MDYTHVLLRYGEIFLKGRNRAAFERKLVNNIKKITSINRVKRLRSRLVVGYFPEHHLLRTVFGLVSYSPAVRVEKNLESIKKSALSFLKIKVKKRNKKPTFKIVTKRSDKTFPLKSPEINIEIGQFIEKNSNLKFAFKNPQTVLMIEINQDGAYLFLETVKCFGGLPTGVEGKVVLLIEDEASLLAGILFMKRGCNIFPVAFEKRDISLLQKFSPIKLNLNIVKSFSEMEQFAKDKKVEVIVSGQNFEHYKKYNSGLLVFRPLISYLNKKIKAELTKFSS